MRRRALTKDLGERLAPRPASAARPRTPWNSPLLDFPCVPFFKHWDIVTESVEGIGRKTHQYTTFRRPDVRLLREGRADQSGSWGLVRRGSGLATRARFPDGGGAAGSSRREAWP